MKFNKIGMVFGLLYVFSIVAANLLISLFGVFCLYNICVPAGALMVGATFTLRDRTQQEVGKYSCWYWMLLAAAITSIFSGEVALASTIAFLLSESADWVVFTYSKYSPRKRSILSNIIGIPVDSFVFVPLIFGWDYKIILGQIIVKIIASFAFLWAVKR